jgi:hypothetical protein
MDIPVNEKVHVHSASQPIPKMETIIFMNNRDPGVTLHFHYASKTHPLRLYDLIHGQQYELPVEVIQHLEGQRAFDPWACHSRMYGQRKRADGTTETFINGYKSYFQCKAVRKAA